MSVPTVLTIPDHAKGILLCVIGVMVLTPDTLLIRKAAEGTSTPTLLFFRYGFHGCSVLSYILATEKSKAWDTIKGIGKLGVLAGVLLGAANIFFTYGVEYTAVANVLVILACNPLFAALFSWALVGEVVKARTAATMCVSLGAIALIFYDQIGADSTDKSGLGNVFAVAAAVLLGLFFAVVHFAKKRLERDINMVPCNIMAGVFVVIVSLLLGARPDSTSVWSPPLHTFGYLALQGLLSMPVSFSLFTVALHYVTAPEVSMFFLVETCLGPLWVWLGGYEAPPPFTLLGGGIVILVLIIHRYCI
ncbi:unnamed protein product [Ectocarpus fasciculatus]